MLLYQSHQIFRVENVESCNAAMAGSLFSWHVENMDQEEALSDAVPSRHTYTAQLQVDLAVRFDMKAIQVTDDRIASRFRFFGSWPSPYSNCPLNHISLSSVPCIFVNSNTHTPPPHIKIHLPSASGFRPAMPGHQNARFIFPRFRQLVFAFVAPGVTNRSMGVRGGGCRASHHINLRPLN